MFPPFRANTSEGIHAPPHRQGVCLPRPLHDADCQNNNGAGQCAGGRNNRTLCGELWHRVREEIRQYFVSYKEYVWYKHLSFALITLYGIAAISGLFFGYITYNMKWKNQTLADEDFPKNLGEHDIFPYNLLVGCLLRGHTIVGSIS